MDLAGDAIGDVVVALLVIGMLRIVQMARDPVASEESLRRHTDIVLNGLPELAITTTLYFEVRFVENAIEDSHRRFTIAFDARRHFSSAHHVKERSCFGFVRRLYVAVQLSRNVVL